MAGNKRTYKRYISFLSKLWDEIYRTFPPVIEYVSQLIFVYYNNAFFVYQCNETHYRIILNFNPPHLMLFFTKYHGKLTPLRKPGV